MIRFVIAMCFWGATILPSVAAVISGPIINPANDHKYYLLEQNFWDASQAEAITLGGNLVTVNDAAEEAWLISQFGPIDRDNSPNSFWIGLNDLAVEGQFEWVSGEPVTYLNWHSGEPNGHLLGPEHEYVYIGRFANGQWNDDRKDVFGYPLPRGVVEISIPEPGTLLGFLLTLGFSGSRMFRLIASKNFGCISAGRCA